MQFLMTYCPSKIGSECRVSRVLAVPADAAVKVVAVMIVVNSFEQIAAFHQLSDQVDQLGAIILHASTHGKVIPALLHIAVRIKIMAETRGLHDLYLQVVKGTKGMKI